MHNRTKRDLDNLDKIKDYIDRLREEERAVKAKCKHYDYKCQYVETLKCEFDPWRLCVVCNTRLTRPNDKEKVDLLREWYSDIEVPLTQSIISRDKDGFNLPRPTMKVKEQDE